MNTLIYWFRQDLRLHDQPALARALQHARATGAALLPVCCVPPDTDTPYGFARVGPHRRAFEAQTRAALAARLRALGSDLLILAGAAAQVLPRLAAATGATQIWCEAIRAPWEAAEEAALARAGLKLECHWHSSLLDPADLPFEPEAVPTVFTAFRQAVEGAGVRPAPPLPTPDQIPGWEGGAEPRWCGQPWPAWQARWAAQGLVLDTPAPVPCPPAHPHSLFPYAHPACQGGEAAAQAHWETYLAQGLPHSYKATRNQVMGFEASSKLSPWLATGALSPRWAWARLQDFEARHGASASSYWLWFELLWRDHFRWLHWRHGAALYRARGLSERPLPTSGPDQDQAFARWCQGATGEALVDAGMRELAATGFLSNRLRQIVASYLIHDLGGDWRAGAAWFEAQLVDFDVYSNQGNWLYIAGRGTDPRGGRRFDPLRQGREHDPDGRYRARWGAT